MPPLRTKLPSIVLLQSAQIICSEYTQRQISTLCQKYRKAMRLDVYAETRAMSIYFWGVNGIQTSSWIESFIIKTPCIAEAFFFCFFSSVSKTHNRLFPILRCQFTIYDLTLFFLLLLHHLIIIFHIK
jgi:hypothetical protein